MDEESGCAPSAPAEETVGEERDQGRQQIRQIVADELFQLHQITGLVDGIGSDRRNPNGFQELWRLREMRLQGDHPLWSIIQAREKLNGELEIEREKTRRKTIELNKELEIGKEKSTRYSGLCLMTVICAAGLGLVILLTNFI